MKRFVAVGVRSAFGQLFRMVTGMYRGDQDLSVRPEKPETPGAEGELPFAPRRIHLPQPLPFRVGPPGGELNMRHFRKVRPSLLLNSCNRRGRFGGELQ